jgi:hypothetical protein
MNMNPFLKRSGFFICCHRAVEEMTETIAEISSDLTPISMVSSYSGIKRRMLIQYKVLWHTSNFMERAKEIARNR